MKRITAKMTVRSTYALDEQTAQNIRRLARDWHVSQAEVIRRSMRQATEAHKEKALTPADVVAHYRSNTLPRSKPESDRVARALHAWRHADDESRAGSKTP